MKAALAAYRERLANYNRRNDRAMETRLYLFERLLFRRKLGLQFWTKEHLGTHADKQNSKRIEENRQITASPHFWSSC